MNNNARMLVLAPPQVRRTTLQGVCPGRDRERPIEERDTSPYPVAVPVYIDDDDDADTGVYEIGPRRTLPFDCDVAGEKRRV